MSVPSELAKAVRRRVGGRGLSGLVAQALAHELEHEALGSFLEDLDGELGPVPKRTLASARKAWPKR